MTARMMWIGRKLRHAHAPVGDARMNAARGSINGDRTCTRCGHFNCSCPPPPPADVLPDGWRKDVSFAVDFFVHVSGVSVCEWGDEWGYRLPGSFAVRTKPTRGEAMAAALAGLEPPKPAEPKLREGWKVLGEYTERPLYGLGERRVYWSIFEGWRVAGEGALDDERYPTLEAAQLRAEELAGQELQAGVRRGLV